MLLPFVVFLNKAYRFEQKKKKPHMISSVAMIFYIKKLKIKIKVKPLLRKENSVVGVKL